MPKTIRSYRSAAFVCAVLFLSALFLSTSASAATPNIVISQVYGGGGNSGATYKNDFVELFNYGDTPVVLDGWSVQYTSAGATTTWYRTPLTGTIQPGAYYLVQEAAGSGGTVSLPTPNATGSIAMGATAGIVALVSNNTALPNGCPTAGAAVDLVGFGTGSSGAKCFEGAPTPTLSNINAALRAGGGCSDTDHNDADFSVGPPSPRNSATSNICSLADTGSSATVAAKSSTLLTMTMPGPGAVSVVGDLSGIGGSNNASFYNDGTHGDVSSADYTFSLQVTIPLCTTPGPKTMPVTITDGLGRTGQGSVFVNVTVPAGISAAIHEIQGSGASSPMVCETVITQGIVTLVKSDGLYIQEPDLGDSDPTTSDGVYVYTGKGNVPAGIAVGQLVQVTGQVSEYVPGSDLNSPPLTEIVGSPLSFTVISSDQPLPAPIDITSLDPNGGLGQLERYEGMRVHVASLVVSGPTLGSVSEVNATAVSNGLFFGVLPSTARPFREAGIEAPDPIPMPPCCIPQWDDNPERLRVDTSALAAPLDVASGAVVVDITGPLDFGYRTYSIVAEPGIAVSDPGTVAAVPVDAPTDAEFTIANMNLQHFYDTVNDPGSDVALTDLAYTNRKNKVSLAIRHVMRSPDIIGVEEAEHISVLQSLAAKIDADAATAGEAQPHYQAVMPPGLNPGNDSSDINVGFLVKPRITVHSFTQYGKDDKLPGNTSQVLNDRPPVVLDAEVINQGESLPFYVIVNHLRSLSGLEDPTGIARPKRKAQAEFLADLIQNVLGNSSVNIVSVGDYNAYQHEAQDGYVDVMGTILGTPTDSDHVAAASAKLVDPAMTDVAMLPSFPAEQRYSYVYDGTAQLLDHVLVNQKMLAQFSRIEYARNNADFPEAYRSDATRPERYSDHDMPVAYFNLPTDHTPPALTLPADFTVEGTSAAGAVVTFTATATDFVDGATAVLCTPASGSTFALGKTEVSCSSTDKHSNTATGKFNVTVVDTTAPLVSVTGVKDGETYTLGAVPVAGCSTVDDVTGVKQYATLALSGGTANGVGTFTANCSGGADNAGNEAPAVSATYQVHYAFGGFALGMGAVAKGGSTVPVKFGLRNAGGNLITTTNSVQSIQGSACSGVPFPAVATGGTALRFAGDGFIFNWKTEKSWTGCYNFLVTLEDGTTKAAVVQFN